jgi:hypothetical protein
VVPLLPPTLCFLVFPESAHMAPGALDSTVQVAILFKILFQGGSAHVLKKLQDIDDK